MNFDHFNFKKEKFQTQTLGSFIFIHTFALSFNASCPPRKTVRVMLIERYTVCKKKKRKKEKKEKKKKNYYEMEK